MKSYFKYTHTHNLGYFDSACNFRLLIYNPESSDPPLSFSIITYAWVTTSITESALPVPFSRKGEDFSRVLESGKVQKSLSTLLLPTCQSQEWTLPRVSSGSYMWLSTCFLETLEACTNFPCTNGLHILFSDCFILPTYFQLPFL